MAPEIVLILPKVFWNYSCALPTCHNASSNFFITWGSNALNILSECLSQHCNRLHYNVIDDIYIFQETTSHYVLQCVVAFCVQWKMPFPTYFQAPYHILKLRHALYHIKRCLVQTPNMKLMLNFSSHENCPFWHTQTTNILPHAVPHNTLSHVEMSLIVYCCPFWHSDMLYRPTCCNMLHCNMLQHYCPTHRKLLNHTKTHHTHIITCRSVVRHISQRFVSSDNPPRSIARDMLQHIITC